MDLKLAKSAKHIYLTGGLGYVGGRCSQGLANDGYFLSLGTRRAASLPRPSWLTHGQLSYYATDLSVAELAHNLAGVDTIIHLASPNENSALVDPEFALQHTAIATLRLCQAAKQVGVQTMLYFSTAHVYAAPLLGTFDESSPPAPRHPYAYSHLAAEHIINSFSGIGGIPSCVILRLTNSFGAPERLDIDRWTLVVNDLCRQAAQLGYITLLSDGRGIRDFICLSDVVRSVAHLMNLTSLQPFEIFNVGLGKTMSILEIAKLIANRGEALLGKPIPVTFIPSRDSGNEAFANLNISIEKLRETGFNWVNDIRDEIDQTLRLCAVR